MAATAGLPEVVLYDTLVNYLVSMARTVEGAMNRALDSIVSLESPRTSALPGEVFLLEPRINEMEIVIDEHAIRLLRRGSFTDDEMRLSLGALIFRNLEMATEVLGSDDVVDQYRDRIFEQLLQHMTQEPTLVSPGLQFILATRHLERIADHATNIAEDIIFWVRGLDVRHGRGFTVRPDQTEASSAGVPSSRRIHTSFIRRCPRPAKLSALDLHVQSHLGDRCTPGSSPHLPPPGILQLAPGISEYQ